MATDHGHVQYFLCGLEAGGKHLRFRAARGKDLNDISGTPDTVGAVFRVL